MPSRTQALPSRVQLVKVSEPLSQASYHQRETDHARKGWWSRQFWQITRFAIVGCLNTLIDLLMLNALLWLFPTRDTVMMLAFNSLAYITGAVNSFLLNKYWTFRHRGRMTLREVLRFVLTTVAGVVCSDALLWGAGILLRPVITNQTVLTNTAKIVAVLSMAVVSYLGMRLWVFVHNTSHAAKEQ